VQELLDLGHLPQLQPSPRMPVLFVGHGSPMNVIEDNHWRRSWQTLGQQFADPRGHGANARYPAPQLILCISAHWLTRGWQVTGMERPATIHDFGGFPQALFDMQYPAPGWPAVAEGISAALRHPPVEVDEHQWGLDHGAWSVLQPMFPAARIPVMQLSMDYSRPPQEHLALGRQLRALRERGVLIVGSGNIVHNLRAMVRTAADDQAQDWALEFDAITTRHLRESNPSRLADFLNLGELARLAHPTHEHFLPLLHAAGAVYPGEEPVFFNEGFQMGAISMRSVVWG
jgi:4,5-DOPA dioxygenase extradiol